MKDYHSFAKLAKPGPRYTSYPTAVEFSTDFKYERYLELLAKSTKNLSLYFHLPFCRSACYFCGCNVIYTAKEESKERYLGFLFREMDILKQKLDCKQEVNQLHFGGGTPTYFSADQLQRLISKIKEIFPNFSKDAEISCEIDPRFLTSEQAKVFVDGGFNRISFGVQDFNDKVQREIHRIQSFETTQKSMQMLRDLGVKSINVDLIYGLPYQSLESFQATLSRVLELAPNRLAIFNYAHVPWLKKNMRKLDESTLPGPSEKLAILEYCEQFLGKNGFEMIGMDHFARKDDELYKALQNGTLHRNFQGYTTKKGAKLVGIGLTSIGEGEDYYAQNHKEMKPYEEAINKGLLPFAKGIELSFDDRLRKALIGELMSNYHLDIKALEKEFGVSFFDYFKDDLKKLEELSQFYEINENELKVNESGVLLIRNLVMCFDTYLAKISKEKQVFSKTI